MAYSEAAFYVNCSVGSTYYEAANFCEVTYSDYSDCEVTYDNYSDGYSEYFDSSTCFVGHVDYSECSESYGDDRDCETTYGNYANDCHITIDYTNHIDYTAYDTGGAQTLSWNSSNWTGDSMNATYIAESISALTEIRDNIKYISENKGQQSVSSSNVESASGNSADSIFNDNNTSTSEFVDDLQYDAMRDTLENLYVALTGASSGLSEKNVGDRVNKSDWNSIKTKASSLMSSYTNLSYSNHLDYEASAYVNYSETTYGVSPE